MVSSVSNSVRSVQADAAVDALDSGTTDATGELRIYTAAFASLLVSCLLSNPAAGSATNGVATFNAISVGTAGAAGTAAAGRMVDRDNATVWEFTVGTSGTELILSNTTIAVNDEVTIASGATYTQPAS